MNEVRQNMPSSIRMIGFFLSPSNYNKLLNVSTFFYLWRVLLNTACSHKCRDTSYSSTHKDIHVTGWICSVCGKRQINYNQIISPLASDQSISPYFYNAVLQWFRLLVLWCGCYYLYRRHSACESYYFLDSSLSDGRAAFMSRQMLSNHSQLRKHSSATTIMM